jgi:hypothetical protein
VVSGFSSVAESASSGNQTSQASAGRVDTAGAGADAVPRSANFPDSGAAGRARCALPEPREPEPPGCSLPGFQEPAGCASPDRPRIDQLQRNKKPDAGQRGGQGRSKQLESAGTIPSRAPPHTPFGTS